MTAPLRLTSIDNLLLQSGRLVFDVNGIDIHFNFRPSTQENCDTLFIGFHSSVERASQKVAAFMPYMKAEFSFSARVLNPTKSTLYRRRRRRSVSINTKPVIVAHGNLLSDVEH